MNPIKSEFCKDCLLWPCLDCDDDTEIFDCPYKETKGKMLKPKRIDLDRLEIKKKYESGISMKKLSKELACSDGTIKRILLKQGVKVKGRVSGKEHPCWRGGRTKTVHGYWKIKSWENPKSDIHGYIYEHVLIWEKTHNRKLPQGWIVHHLNGVKDDNRPQNLIAMKKSEHTHQSEVFKKRIRELEIENAILRQGNLFNDSREL